MTRHTATWLAWGLWVLTLALTAVAVTLVNVAGVEDYSRPGTLVVAWAAIQAYATVGALVASRRPENPIGWLFLAAPALMMGANALDG